MQIQNQKKQNIILNSKSEYNRCALPRLTAKIGNFSLDELDRRKKEEKEKEKQWATKIGKLRATKKKEQSKNRRETPTETVMPAEKRRKMDWNKYMRVKQVDEKKEKRKEYEDDNRWEENYDKKRRIDEKQNQDAEEAPEVPEPTVTEQESLWESEEETKRHWNQMLEERDARMKTEEEEREKRCRKAEKLEKSWHLLKLCRNHEQGGREMENFQGETRRRKKPGNGEA